MKIVRVGTTEHEKKVKVEKAGTSIPMGCGSCHWSKQRN